MTLTLRVLALALTLGASLAAQCTLSFTPETGHAAAAGGDATFVVNASVSNCPRTATSNNPDWITVSFGQTSNGTSSTVGYTTKASTVAQARTGSITVNSQQFSITQDAAACNYTLTPATQSIPAAGGNYNLKVDTTCVWTPFASVPWITIASPSAVTGAGTVAYSATPNLTQAARSGAIQIGTAALPIMQFGTACTYALSPSAAAFPAAGGKGQVSVQTDATCAWTAQNPVPWITGVATGSMTGPGTVSYMVAANTSPTARTSPLTIAGQPEIVSQAGVGIQFSAGSVANGASFAAGAVAAGEIVTIFGTGLGPAAGVALQLAPGGQSITTSLGGTRVLFDGLAAPMIYAADGQVSAIVPFSLAGAVSTKLTVEVQGVASTPVALSVTAAAPAIFTSPATGSGQSATLNQDYSVNGTGNPARAGSVVQIFATGGGQTAPAGVDAQLTGSALSIPLLAVTAQIGGMPAQVTYAGSAPGLVAGVLQVNVLVPANAPSGGAVPVAITVGTQATQTAVTLAIL